MFNSYVKLPEGSIAMSLLRFEMNSCTFRITGYQHIYSHLSIYIIALFLFLFMCIYIHTHTHTHTYIYIRIGSMYGIYANIWGILMVNVTIYSIHGSYGIYIYIYIHDCVYSSYGVDFSSCWHFSKPCCFFCGGLHTLFTGLECPGSRSLGPAALFLVILLVVAAMVLMASWSLIYEKFSSVTFDRTSGSIRKKKNL